MANWFPNRVEVAVLLLLNQAQQPLSAKNLVERGEGFVTRYRLQEELERMAHRTLLTEVSRRTIGERTEYSYTVGPEGKDILQALKLLKITLEGVPPVKIRTKRRGKPRPPRRGGGGQPPPSSESTDAQ